MDAVCPCGGALRRPDHWFQREATARVKGCTAWGRLPQAGRRSRFGLAISALAAGAPGQPASAAQPGSSRRARRHRGAQERDGEDAESSQDSASYTGERQSGGGSAGAQGGSAPAAPWPAFRQRAWRAAQLAAMQLRLGQRGHPVDHPAATQCSVAGSLLSSGASPLCWCRGIATKAQWLCELGGGRTGAA